MRNLQDLIDGVDNFVEYLRNDVVSPFHRSRTELFASLGLIPREFSNWRDEQRASRETCTLNDQSHHMPVLFVRGPDAERMLNYLSPCSFKSLSTDSAKQYFACTPRGHHIGDCVLQYYGEQDGFELISGMPLLNWVRFHAETGEYDVEIKFDPTTPFNPTGRRTKFRFQVEGPAAREILEEAAGGRWPDLNFFKTGPAKIAGCDLLVLRHGMGSVGGAEISGDYAHLDAVRDAILTAGQKHGIRQGGTITYFSSPIVGGWAPYPLPGIYTGEELRAYRRWLPADSWEANMQLAGSLVSDDIEDYYWTPSALGYDRFVKFDHDFIGRGALEAALSQPRKVKRLLLWNENDIARVYRSQLSDGPVYKSIDLPTPIYGWPQADEVRSPDGLLIGMSQFIGYTVNERAILSVSCIDENYAEPGTEVIITWGEPDGGSRKPQVERHEQTAIRATVHEAPFVGSARNMKKSAL